MPKYPLIPDLRNVSLEDLIRAKPDSSAQEILEIFSHIEGIKVGTTFRRAIKRGLLVDEININLNDLNFINDQIPPFILGAKLKLKPCEFGYASNSVVVLASIYSGGTSCVSIFSTTNPTARFFYALSVLFSTTAMGASGSAVIAKRCEVSSIGICTEAIGLACLKLGNQARLIAEQAEGKSILRKPRRRLDFLRRNNHNAGFIMPGDNLNTDILSQKVLTGLAITFTLYGYGKFLIKSYKYGQKFYRKILSENLSTNNFTD
jgi:hypothetical protein